MIEERAESRIFGQLARDLLESGLGFRFQAKGRSMLPTIADGDILQVERVEIATLRIGDIVLFKDGLGFKAHRVIRKRKDVFVTRGDAGLEADSTISGWQIVGKIVTKECAEPGHRVALEGVVPRLGYFSSQLRRAVSRKVRRWRLVARGTHCLMPFSLIVLFMTMSLAAWSQISGVALDDVSSQGFVTGSTGCTGTNPTFTCTFNHTTHSVIGTTGLLGGWRQPEYPEQRAGKFCNRSYLQRDCVDGSSERESWQQSSSPDFLSEEPSGGQFYCQGHC